MTEWPRFEERTKAFAQLYRQVSDDIVEHARNHSDPRVTAWLLFLVAGFQREYEGWATKRHIWPVLEAIESRVDLFCPRVYFHVFLHITYDLPRVLADSLSDETGQFDDLDRPAKRQSYFELSKIFEGSFRRSAGRLSVFGAWVPLAVVFSRVPLALVALLQHLYNLRSGAWAVAVELADSYDRGSKEEKLFALVSRLVARADLIDLLRYSPGGVL